MVKPFFSGSLLNRQSRTELLAEATDLPLKLRQGLVAQLSHLESMISYSGLVGLSRIVRESEATLGALARCGAQLPPDSPDREVWWPEFGRWRTAVDLAVGLVSGPAVAIDAAHELRTGIAAVAEEPVTRYWCAGSTQAVGPDRRRAG